MGGTLEARLEAVERRLGECEAAQRAQGVESPAR